MKSALVALLSLVSLLAVSARLDVADMSPATKTDSSALAMAPAEIPTDTSENPDASLTKMNATVSGNNLLVTRSNIIVVGDQAKKGMVDFIKNLVMKGSSPQDDDALSTQIITVLGGGNSTATNSDLATKIAPTIKSAFQSREKPAQLRQIIVKLTEMSPKFGMTEVGDHEG
ncbi:hypothetical protein GN244_ATG11904 [Phytophthora infestans]|uniref:Secreted RxLR effector peptide protein n=1 Tax=Phytophthora infestans TaxID=4787 RepID=A0A833RZD7_PHYIN|nr:hypothetical protein GN244_ATG11904 [Phytophthora infestans]KAF4145044.1 hypothetical protein GN958_ATG05751 [Phytophthora infestans]KAI9979694.1 hypothetical protein PInf_028070 [Phytophthora infestans]KAI9990231.1 hypothetical protein PInf_021040 [Phytophthora infestans]KAI9997932.1 hypothetical protein PInf_002190 [Phytophthora infestans]